jgi:hypothetical protein
LENKYEIKLSSQEVRDLKTILKLARNWLPNKAVGAQAEMLDSIHCMADKLDALQIDK